MISETLSTQPFFNAVGWALLHSLWQAAAVGLVLAGVLALLKGRSPNARYAAACAALALMLLLPAATAWNVSRAPGASAVDEMSLAGRGRTGAGASIHSAAFAASHLEPAHEGVASEPRRPQKAGGLEGVLPWLSLLWTLGVLFLSARTVGGLVYTRRLGREGTREVADYWRGRLAELSLRLRVTRPVRLLESTLVEVPTVAGWLKPVILLPASALVGLAPRQLEVVLAHELAHIRRHDYLVNLLQTVAETLLFYHPAAWWVSRQVRAEREHACDDMAVGVCGDALTYARALTTMERLRRTQPQLTLAASGGGLRGRVLRLVGSPQEASRPSPLLVGAVFFAALLMTVACTQAALSQKNRGDAPNGVNASVPSNATADDARNKAARVSTRNLPREVAALVDGDNTEGEDPEVRRAAVEALGNRAGSVVVMDPRTGRVYAVVNQEWAVRRSWLPASTMKVVVGVAAVNEKMFNPSEKVKVADRAERIDLTDAMALSNNPYFESLGERVGAERIIDYARRLGYGEATGVNIEGETAGRLPAAGGVRKAGWFGAHGEGVEVTPMQLATLYSAIANGGTLVVPRVPRTADEAARFEPQVRRRLDVARETLEQIVPGLVAAVERGSGSEAKGAPVPVAGKTGSAGKENHGIFASYAPANDPRLVVVVFTRGKGENGPAAAGVAGTIYKALANRLRGGE